MVDVAEKGPTLRTAVARAEIRMREETLRLILSGEVAKGDVFAVARVAGIMAAKETPRLIPLCHSISLTSVRVDFEPRPPERLLVRAEARAFDRTGAEMEALTAASVAALAVYDMCKAVDRAMTVERVALEEKAGGRSGHFRRLPPAVSFVGRSGAGKTTLIERLLPLISARGYRVATIKHDAHDFEIDHPGKDSWRHAQAGARSVALASARKLALVRHLERELAPEELRELVAEGADLVLVEGYRQAPWPKVEVYRPEVGEPVAAGDPRLLAIVGETRPPGVPPEVPLFRPEKTEELMVYLLSALGLS
jgi:molybdenum cofactor biosynthesis protein MoaC/molybdopterin-guanine dinucleotide biosynthesis protein MobB